MASEERRRKGRGFEGRGKDLLSRHKEQEMESESETRKGTPNDEDGDSTVRPEVTDCHPRDSPSPASGLERQDQGMGVRFPHQLLVLHAMSWTPHHLPSAGRSLFRLQSLTNYLTASSSPTGRRWQSLRHLGDSVSCLATRASKKREMMRRRGRKLMHRRKRR